MNAPVIARADGATAEVLVRRPQFADVWASYPKQAAKDVYGLIAGEVGGLYQEPAKKKARQGSEEPPEPPKPFDDACALRLSRALNYAGVHIAHAGAGRQASGADGKRYLVTFEDMAALIRRNWGAPEKSVKAGGADVRGQFAGKKGVMVFQVSGWQSAQGHITLWDGAQCADRAYFEHEPLEIPEGAESSPYPEVKTTEVLLWELK